MLYRLMRPLLFRLEAETAHHLTLESLKHAQRLNIFGHAQPMSSPIELMGLQFPNRVGLAAGLDKNGEYLDALAALGFGFIEIGTVTPRPQPGNPKPRLFRIPEANALINRMGFNNNGVDALVARVKRAKYNGILGINIGKNFDTPNDRAADDYLECLRKVYAQASYVAINISSPNTQGLRELQKADAFNALLASLSEEREKLADAHGKRVPLAVKIAPDLEPTQIRELATAAITHRIDAVIATNTTVTRDGVANMRHANESGGLSGAPLCEKSNDIVRELAGALRGSLPIIGVGGIQSGADARKKFAAGASLVQLYTGLVYRGPRVIDEILAGS
ncbi:MAG: quinone-dependent dihydroorotate dehydrogenase [Pseudomonadota bacterium]|nr:quinone-dependent dihydroorotate dehydrogenase [Pseudomonadota bacterium]